MRITQGMIEVEHPLTFDIYTEEGTLLLRKGVVIYNQSQIDNIYERRCYNTPDGEVELFEEAPSDFRLNTDIPKLNLCRTGECG